MGLSASQYIEAVRVSSPKPGWMYETDGNCSVLKMLLKQMQIYID